MEGSGLDGVLHRLLDCAKALDADHIDAVTVALADSQHELRHLLGGRLGAPSGDDPILLVDTVHALAPLVSGTHATFAAYARVDHQLLFPGREHLRAVGIAPLARRDRLIGSVNVASEDPAGLDAVKASGRLERVRVMAALAIQNAVNAARLRRSGTMDLLTGWHNQQYFRVRLHEEVARSERERRALACVLVDIDDFRELNARYGYRAGDEVLLEVTQRIESVMRRSDVAIRCGSEEFALLLPNTEEQQGAPLVRRIRDAVMDAPFDVGVASGVSVSVSIGVAAYRPGERTIDAHLAGSELLARAQLALYESQARRKSRPRDARLE